MSVKLMITWSEPLKIARHQPDVMERNASYLRTLYHDAGVHAPPVMKWTFMANPMQSYTGNKEEVFSKVNFHESKQQVYWKHRLRQAFSTKTQDDAVHRYALFFAHGTNTAGAEGILNRRYLAPTALAVGHYSQATN